MHWREFSSLLNSYGEKRWLGISFYGNAFSLLYNISHFLHCRFSIRAQDEVSSSWPVWNYSFKANKRHQCDEQHLRVIYISARKITRFNNETNVRKSKERAITKLHKLHRLYTDVCSHSRVPNSLWKSLPYLQPPKFIERINGTRKVTRVRGGGHTNCTEIFAPISQHLVGRRLLSFQENCKTCPEYI